MKHFLLSALLAGAVATPAWAADLTHWEHQYDARTAVLQSLVDSYQKSSGDKIDFQPIPYDSYFDKLTTALSTGTGPDVFKVPATMAYQLIKAGLVAPAPADVMTADKAKTDYLSWAVDPAIQNGQLYGLPTDVQTVVMYINDDLLKSCGGDPAKPPTTWDEFSKLSKACTKREDGKLVQAGVDTRYKWAVYTTFMYQAADGKVVDATAQKAVYDSPEGMKAWDYMADLFTGPNAVDEPTFMTGQFKFELGKALFYLNHPTTRSRLSSMSPDLKYTIAMPPSPDGHGKTIASSWLYMVNANSKNAEAAWKWIAYITNEDAQKLWVEKGSDLPALNKSVDDPSFFPDANAKVVEQSLKNVYVPEEIGGNPIDDIRQAIWDQMTINGTDAKTAVTAQIAKENDLIKQTLQ